MCGEGESEHVTLCVKREVNNNLHSYLLIFAKRNTGRIKKKLIKAWKNKVGADSRGSRSSKHISFFCFDFLESCICIFRLN